MSQVRSQYSPRLSITVNCEEPTLTQQHFKDEVDVTNIVNRYALTRDPTILKRTQEIYGDATSISFTEAMHTVKQAESEFHELPDEVKAQYNYEPSEWLQDVVNPQPGIDQEQPEIDLAKVSQAKTEQSEVESEHENT